MEQNIHGTAGLAKSRPVRVRRGDAMRLDPVDCSSPTASISSQQLLVCSLGDGRECSGAMLCKVLSLCLCPRKTEAQNTMGRGLAALFFCSNWQLCQLASR